MVLILIMPSLLYFHVTLPGIKINLMDPIATVRLSEHIPAQTVGKAKIRRKYSTIRGYIGVYRGI